MTTPCAATVELASPWIGHLGARFCLRGALALVQIPVVETRLAGTVLLRVFVNEVPPSGERDKPQNGPLKCVEPTEEVPSESSGRLPPGRRAARDDENSEFGMKGECSPREPTLMHSESVGAQANSGWSTHECGVVPRCFGFAQTGLLVSTSWGQGNKRQLSLAQRPDAGQVHPSEPSE